MSLEIAGVNIFNQTLDNEYRVTVLEKIIEKVIAKNPAILNEEGLKEIRDESIILLQKKYPNAGIKTGRE